MIRDRSATITSNGNMKRNQNELKENESKNKERLRDRSNTITSIGELKNNTNSY